MSEVPQGTVLGPLLFVIFINDIDDCMAGKILKLADDTKIYQTVIWADVSALQSGLSNVVVYGPKNGKRFSRSINVRLCI